jgi:cysteinyl-tRNA synthetase
LEEAKAAPIEKADGGPHGLVNEIGRLRDRFREEMEDDLNTAGALGAVFEAVKAINSALRESPALGPDTLGEAEDFLKRTDEILGVLGIGKESESGPSDEEIESRVSERAAAKKNKDFKLADAIRSELLEHGVILEDTSQGTRWKRQI